MDEDVSLIINELKEIYKVTDSSQFKSLIEHIMKANKIICYGSGRVGLAMRGFSMRLTHLGFTSFYMGETNVPRLGKSDLLIIGSGSGMTQTILKVAEIAREKDLTLFLITARSDSKIKSIADESVILGKSNINSKDCDFTSAQPMTTLFELCLNVFLDSSVLKLMRATEQNTAQLANRHNVLE
jgi:6-phospho-3-hexuloisomerase